MPSCSSRTRWYGPATSVTKYVESGWVVSSSHSPGATCSARGVADHHPVGRRGHVEGVRRLQVGLVEAGEDAGRGVHEGHAVDVVPAVGRVDASGAGPRRRCGTPWWRRRPARWRRPRSSAGSRPRDSRSTSSASPLSRSACTACGLRSTNVGPPCEVNRIVVTERKVDSSDARSSRTSYPSTMSRSKRAWASVCWRLWKGFVTPPTLCRGTPGSRMGKGRRIPPTRRTHRPTVCPPGRRGNHSRS